VLLVIQRGCEFVICGNCGLPPPPFQLHHPVYSHTPAWALAATGDWGWHLRVLEAAQPVSQRQARRLLLSLKHPLRWLELFYGRSTMAIKKS
jgi:hypothetical protein